MSQEQAEDYENICSICKENFPNFLTRCKHHYHVNCLESWFNTHRNCPLCRTSVTLNPKFERLFWDENAAVETILKEDFNLFCENLIFLSDKKQQKRVFDILVKNVGSFDDKLLECALKIDFFDDFKILFEKYENVVDKNEFLLKCATTGSPDLISFLVEKGADINFEDDNGCTALMLSIDAKGLKEDMVVEIVETLMTLGSEVNYKNKNGETALIKSAYRNQLKVAQILLNNGANLDAKDNENYSALKNAHHKENNELALWLLERGALIEDEEDMGVDLLILAADKNDVKLA